MLFATLATYSINSSYNVIENFVYEAQTVLKQDQLTGMLNIIFQSLASLWTQ